MSFMSYKVIGTVEHIPADGLHGEVEVLVQLGLPGLGDALAVGGVDGHHLAHLATVIVVVGGGRVGGGDLLQVDGGDVLQESRRRDLCLLGGNPNMTSDERMNWAQNISN